MDSRPASPIRELLHLAWPVLVAQLAIVANGAFDTIMAGRLSALDLAAVGIGAAVQATVLVSLLGVLLALPPTVAQLFGAGQRSDIGREIHQAVWISLALGMVIVLLLRFPQPFLAISELQPDVDAKVRAYLDASAWAVPGIVGFRLFFGLSTGIGRPRPVMVFNLLALALKIPLNAVFMYGLLGFPALGGPGCAVATAIDMSLIAVLAWRWCLRHPDYAEFKLGRGAWRPDLEAMLAFLRLGVPIGLTFLADVTAFTFMALFIARLGPVVAGAHQIAANLAVLAYMLPLSLGSATAVLAGHAIGAGQPARARRASWTGIGVGLGLAAILSTLLWSSAPAIAALYTPDPAVRAAAVPLIVLVGFYHLGDALQAVAVNALRGYKRSTVPMLIYAAALWGVGLGGGVALGLSHLFGPPRGAAGFWLAGIGGIVIAGGMVTAYLNAVSRVR
ncbi:MAG TPA: MATE family efflux transporter [Rhodocyclaceae bacterium]